jgi:uncharacterized protein YecE (DUF72 family)
MPREPETRIGISGWTYPPWRGTFYPKGLTQKRELEFASRQLNTIEINGSFYSLQRPKSYEHWASVTPTDFVFSVKATRYITHIRRLKEVEQPLANFLASGLLAFGPKLGPILWQFPPSFRYDAERLKRFFGMLPHSTRQAARLASRHESWMNERALTAVDQDREMRHAIEIRHPSFVGNEEFLDLVRANDLALVVSDSGGEWAYVEEVTADFVYVRLHGGEELYVSGYDAKDLDVWEAKLRKWQGRKRDAYVYFDNDAKVRAPFDAMAFAERFKVKGRAHLLVAHPRHDRRAA